MSTVFHGIKKLLTLKKASRKEGRSPQAEDLSVIRDGCIVSSHGKVDWVGKLSALPSSFLGKDCRRIDLQAEVVLPAFVECHTHTVFAGQRAHEFEMRNSGVSYKEIARRGGGILSTVKATRNASLENLRLEAQERLEVFLRQGVTTIEIKSGYGLRFKDEIKMLEAAKALKKLRVVTTYLGAHAVPKEASSAEAYLRQLIEKDLPKLAKLKLADRVDIFIEDGFFDLAGGGEFLRRAKDLGFGVTVHADQIGRTGAGRLACELDALSADHLVQADDRDIGRLAKSRTTAVLLPAADFYLQMEYPPARKMLDAGVRVALATDFNPGSCPTQDLAFVGLLARMRMKMTLPEVIVAYTLGAAYALGKGDQLGSLEVGKDCDFSVLDGDWNDLFYHVGRQPVAQVWSRGRRLWRASQKS